MSQPRFLPFLLVAFLATGPAGAETIAPAAASARVGQAVTVRGTVEDVHTISSGMTFLDMGGRYPANTLSVVIFSADAGKFPNVRALSGKVAEITGPVELYKGKPEIVLKDVAQLKSQ